MLKRNKEERERLELICMEDLVPKDHILREIGSAIYFTNIYDLAGELYCPDNGRPSIDPAVIFKMAMILLRNESAEYFGSDKKSV